MHVNTNDDRLLQINIGSANRVLQRSKRNLSWSR